MESMDLYNSLKSVPQEYTKEIKGGRLKGMTDIKPQWRIMKLTEAFGACGFGWKVQNVQFSYEVKGDETVCNCSLEFLYKLDGKWSAPIPGFGGSMFSTVESKGVYVSDEAQKMAYTDAISVATKMIGLASDVYMGHAGKYADNENKGDNDQSKGTSTPTPVGIAPTLAKVISSADSAASLNTIWNNNAKLQENKDFIKLIAMKRIEFALSKEDLSKIFDEHQILHADIDFVTALGAKKKGFINSDAQQKQTA